MLLKYKYNKCHLIKLKWSLKGCLLDAMTEVLVSLLSPALLSDEGRADVCGRKASHFFSLAESLRSPKADPFTWVFIRPPWSPTGSCCKAVVFDRLKAECDNNMVGSAAASSEQMFFRPE